MLAALGTTAAPAQVKIAQPGTEKISVEIDGKPFTDFWIGPSTAKPYLHPLRAASGVVVTRGYPMIPNVPGEAHDHPHHRGLWFTHGDVNGYDFWANEDSQPGAGKGKGKVVLKRVDKLTSGKRSGSIEATFEWKIPSGATLLRESRKMTFYEDPQFRIIDFDMTLSPEQTVTFGDTKEGMFAMRLAAALEEEQPKDIAEPKRTGRMVNAQGKQGEKNVWGKRSEWVDYSGQIDGQDGGSGDPGLSRQPAHAHLLARPRLRPVRLQHFRGTRFRERQIARRQPDHSAGPAAALPLPGDHPPGQQRGGGDSRSVRQVQGREVGPPFARTNPGRRRAELPVMQCSAADRLLFYVLGAVSHGSPRHEVQTSAPIPHAR